MTRKTVALNLLPFIAMFVLLRKVSCAGNSTPKSDRFDSESEVTIQSQEQNQEVPNGQLEGSVAQVGQTASDGDSGGSNESKNQMQLAKTVSADDAVPTPTNNPEAQTEPNPDALMKISVGSNHACGIREDQTLVCWGGNESGQADPPEGTFTEIASGNNHSCAINTESGVECWGNNSYAAASPPTSTILKLDGYQDTYCGVQTNHAISCWGYDSNSGSWPAGKFRDLDIRGPYNGCAVNAYQETECWKEAQPFTIDGKYQGISVGEDNLACGVDQFNVVRCWDMGNGLEFMKLYGQYREVSVGENGWLCAVTLDDELSCSHGLPQLVPAQLEGVKIKSFEASPNEEIACS